MEKPKSLIINSPYERPAQHWLQARDNTLRTKLGTIPVPFLPWSGPCW